MSLPHLTDLGFVRKNREGRPVHRFRCSCGKEKDIQLRYVRNGTVKSCGCLRGIIGRQFLTTHGMRNHPLYQVHSNMMRRCYDKLGKDYPDYGARGVTVVGKWHNVRNFIADMEAAYHPGLTLDRIDNDQPYSKENCRWATNKVQSRNKRNNVLYKEECAADATKRLGGKNGLVVMRLRRGWSREKAFTTPIRKT